MKIFTKTLDRLGLSANSEEKKETQIDKDTKDTQSSFKDFSFDLKLQQVIAEEGYTIPTPIQVRAIPIVLEGKDIIACAQTGTGKTAAFALPIIHKLLSDMKSEKQRSYHPKVLVLVPTRELALQVQESFANFGESFGIASVAIIGGVSIGLQFSNLRRRSPQVVVATPGRLLDILEQGGINLSSIHTLILDEADRMLDMGFIPDTKRIVKCIPKERQSLMFSATISSEVNALSKQIMTNPAFVSVAPTRSSAEGIEQLLYPVPQDNKRSLLIHLLESEEMNRVIIFTRTKFSASKLSDSLVREGIQDRPRPPRRAGGR
jgi:ATP-dependent RNA helicase RhlE